MDTSYKFDPAFDQAVDAIARDAVLAPEARSKPDVIRRAVALYKYLHLQIDGQETRRVAIVDGDTIVTRIDPLP